MSSDATPAAAPAKSKKSLLLVVIIVAGVVLGGGAGAFLAGPLLAGGPPPAGQNDSSGAGGDDASNGGEADEAAGRDGKKGAPPVVHLVDNLVLNPAQSGGSRFLLLSVAFAVKDDATAKVLADRDPELRDVIIRYFGARTVDELVDISQRDAMKVQLRATLVERFGKGSVRDVYLPQFVIQ